MNNNRLISITINSLNKRITDSRMATQVTELWTVINTVKIHREWDLEAFRVLITSFKRKWDNLMIWNKSKKMKKTASKVISKILLPKIERLGFLMMSQVKSKIKNSLIWLKKNLKKNRFLKIQLKIDYYVILKLILYK